MTFLCTLLCSTITYIVARNNAFINPGSERVKSNAKDVLS